MTGTPPPARQVVLGVAVSTTSYDGVSRTCRRWIDDTRVGSPDGGLVERGRYICVTSVHGVVTLIFDPSLRAILNGADIVTPDGMPVVWALRSLGCRGQARVYGPDLMLALCRQAAELGHSVFFYGGRPETLGSLAERLKNRFPKLRIAGQHSPPFRPLTPEEDAAVVGMIRSSGADLVFVGISTPKQEKWMADHAAVLPGTILIGVGAAFDFHAGRVRQAPGWMQRAGLEWLFRLASEPRRLWKRYLLVTPVFLPLWLLQKLGILRYPAPATDRA